MQCVESQNDKQGSSAGEVLRDLMTAISASRFNYYAVFVTDFCCGFLFFFLGLRNAPGWPVIGLSVLFGAVLFTLIEYAIHRWLLHTTGILSHLHAAHHASPVAISAFLFPTSVVVLGLFWTVFGLGMHVKPAAFVIAGVGFAYSYYGIVHHLEHRVKGSRLPWSALQHLWAAHQVHHHLDDCNFGVITSFWDYAFGTHHTQMKHKRAAASSSQS